MITNSEFEVILNDASKRIEGDIKWVDDEFHSPAQEFRVPVLNDLDEPLQMNGWYNPYSGKLVFTLLRRGTMRIYGLDLGISHGRQEPAGVYAMHKHRWSEARKDKNIYVPEDITATIEDPVEVWKQFCVEAKIEHHGTLEQPQIQQELWP